MSGLTIQCCWAEKARIHVETPYLSGDVEALCIPEAICDLVVGNVPGARNPDDPDMYECDGQCCDDRETGKTGGRVEAAEGAGCCEAYRSGSS